MPPLPLAAQAGNGRFVCCLAVVWHAVCVVCEQPALAGVARFIRLDSGISDSSSTRSPAAAHSENRRQLLHHFARLRAGLFKQAA